MEMEKKQRLVLIANPGSASRKYALYCGESFLASLHFEVEDKKVVCTLKDSEGVRKPVSVKVENLEDSVAHIHEILVEAGYLGGGVELDAIIVRMVAPGSYFSRDHIVNKEFLDKLKVAKANAPLHAPVTAKEIAHFKSAFPKLTIVAVSDSAFHATKPKLTKYYPIDMELAEKYEIKRYGYHGLSVGSVVRYMKKNDLLAEKMIVCHIGSGSSVTAVFRGESVDNSMGFSPLEGVMMSTRCGNIDVAAALAIKKHLDLSDVELEKYLNKQSGLLGVSGRSGDMRDILQARDDGDEVASFALALYVHKMQVVIGQMAAVLNGVDALVFTATIGERSAEVRSAVTNKLSYLGFKLDKEKNQINLPSGHAELQKDGASKPVFAVKTDEFLQMVVRANRVLDGGVVGF